MYYFSLAIIMENITGIKSVSSVYQYNCHRDNFKFASLFWQLSNDADKESILENLALGNFNGKVEFSLNDSSCLTFPTSGNSNMNLVSRTLPIALQNTVLHTILYYIYIQ